MKLLNYSDMIFYKENGISMSGLKYVHFPYGPVPENFDILLGKMAADHIAHIEVVYENGYEKHQVIPECDIPENIFSEGELEVLERIDAKFKDFGSVDISNYSHKEKGYCATKKRRNYFICICKRHSTGLPVGNKWRRHHRCLLHLSPKINHQALIS